MDETNDIFVISTMINLGDVEGARNEFVKRNISRIRFATESKEKGLLQQDDLVLFFRTTEKAVAELGLVTFHENLRKRSPVPEFVFDLRSMG